MFQSTPNSGQATPVGGLVPMPPVGSAAVRHRSVTAAANADALTVPVDVIHANDAKTAPNDATADTVARGESTVEPRVKNTVKRGFWTPTRRSAVLCLLLVAGIAAVLIPALRAARRAIGVPAGGSFGTRVGQLFGGLLIEGGLPPTGPLFGFGDSTDTTAPGEGADTSAPADTGFSETDPANGSGATGAPPFGGTEEPPDPDSGGATPGTGPSGDPGEDTGREPDATREQEPDAGDDSRPVEPPQESEGSGDAPVDTTRDPAEDSASGGPDEPVTDPSSGTPSEAPDETLGETPGETLGDPKETVGAGDLPGGEPLPDTPSVPVGCYPIVSRDLSESTRGAGYIHNEAGVLPDALPGGALWPQGTPAVLILHTHPYEGFGDGGDCYDPTTGPLGVTDTVSDPDGVVALGIRLTRALRGQGLTVIHLRVAVSPGETADAIYARTAALVRYYCRLYPDIGLVLDLRRSAELTADGAVLRTAGLCRGESIAQLRLTVSGGRSTALLARDLDAALAIRARLWALEPTLSRPVRVLDGTGLAGAVGLDGSGTGGTEGAAPVMLTVEFGSVGNAFSEAAALVAPLAEAIGEVSARLTAG